MRTLINWIIGQLQSKLRKRSRFEAALGGAASVAITENGIRIKRGWRCVELSQKEYLMLLSLQGLQVRRGAEIEVAL